MLARSIARRLRTVSLGTPGAASPSSIFFFFNDTATTEIYTLSLHDALPISRAPRARRRRSRPRGRVPAARRPRSEEHTSELQSQFHLVCRLLLEKKKGQPLPSGPTSVDAGPPAPRARKRCPGARCHYTTGPT